ncbi:paraquat-inducible protein A [Mucilaginibacter ginkgonis]|uniref:Paraquat-inducible protein A n=2 Tax=Mucilaginibacter ginkgonis TaxID=2682091 RepID=A0A6I4I6V5_9SPHI|nr:paraquat-inducible protein A [Mucilaginibacter ginkgonis]
MHALSFEQERIKEDYAMANSITFGLFSIDQWRDRISDVVNHQVTDFKLTAKQKRAIQVAVQNQLQSLVNKTVAEINKPQKSIGGKLKKLAFNAMVDPKDINAQIPGFARTIVNKVSSPSSQRRLKGIATTTLTKLERQTYDSTSVANFYVTKHVYAKYHVGDPYSFNNKINNELTRIRQVSYNYAYAMLGCVLFALVLWWLMRKSVHLQSTLFVMSLLFATVMLVVGATASIIEVDARLQSFSFMLLGEKVEFINQVLFFQSKSLLQIVGVLIYQPKPDAVVVGSLIFIFVLILPLIRLIAKGIHILSPERIAQNKVVRYLAFDSAKWDMADVMVVGIIMTYIGLNGILKSQLSNLNIHNGTLTTVTANETSLQPGYFIFVGYVIFATLLAYILKRITPHKVEVPKQLSVDQRLSST